MSQGIVISHVLLSIPTVAAPTAAVTSQSTLAESNTVEITTPDFQASSSNFEKEENKPSLVSGNWINRLDSSSFIIQFGSAQTLEMLEEAISVINVGKPIAVYRYNNPPADEIVYGIATGVYDNLDEAMAALDTFPPEARTFDIWVRSVALLKQSLIVGETHFGS